MSGSVPQWQIEIDSKIFQGATVSLPTCAVMVLNWNGALWLKQCLPSVVRAASEVNAEVWVVDNDSNDGSLMYCAQNFPNVRFEALGSNKVLTAYNLAASRCTAEVIVFLNNDVSVDQSFLPPLLNHLNSRPQIFSVAPCVKTFPPGLEAAIEAEAEFPVRVRGMIRPSPFSPGTAAYTWYTLGGAMACNRLKFLELQGFDELYLPGYLEDVDLCWRAWKRGWICLYEPQSTVYHAGGSSFGRLQQVKTVILRNEYLCHWKNLSSTSLIASHILATLPRLILAAARRDRVRLKGFADAIGRLDSMMRSRKQARLQFRCGDIEVLNSFRNQQQ